MFEEGGIFPKREFPNHQFYLFQGFATLGGAVWYIKRMWTVTVHCTACLQDTIFHFSPFSSSFQSCNTFVQCVIPNSSLHILQCEIRGLKCIWPQPGLNPDASESKGRIIGRPGTHLKGLGYIVARISHYFLWENPMCLTQILRDLKGLEEGIFYPSMLSFLKLTSFSV